MPPQIAAMPRCFWPRDDRRKTPRRPGSPRTGLTAGDAHVAGQRRALVASIDDEVMALGLAGDGFVDGSVERFVAFRGAERRAQIRGILPTAAHLKRGGARDANPAAGSANILLHRGHHS